MAKAVRYMTIGEAAERCDLATSALRFYESRGLVHSVRTDGNQRRYHPAMLRRISVIKAAQNLGLTLEEITEALARLPDNRTPTKRDWERLSTNWGRLLDERILRMQKLRESLSTCIGCGCLSMRSCALFNADDFVAKRGNGPRYLLEDMPEHGWPES